MAICTACGSVGDWEDMKNHTCTPPMKGQVKKQGGTIELVLND